MNFVVCFMMLIIGDNRRQTSASRVYVWGRTFGAIFSYFFVSLHKIVLNNKIIIIRHIVYEDFMHAHTRSAYDISIVAICEGFRRAKCSGDEMY